MTYLFTSEAVSEGHPDKVCDAVSDAILDLYLSRDNKARTAVETLATTDKIVISGETSSAVPVSSKEIEDVVRQTVKSIGYDQEGFSWRTLNIENYLHKQSADIALGVDKMGAGDQGIMFGYAKKEQNVDTDYMPLAIYLANRILQNINAARKKREIKGFLPDAKSQVTLEYAAGGRALAAKKIVVSTQHEEDLSQNAIRETVMRYVRQALPDGWNINDDDILINPTGRFVIGGPNGDTGLTGRKIIVDTYGGYAPHGGGAFSGKDPTKVDRSAAYMLRYIAKNIVAAGLAEECTLQTSYAIGKQEPLSLFVDTKGTSCVDETKLLNVITEMFDLTPAGIIKHLNLQNPIYLPTASYGHFGRAYDKEGHFTWEKTDKTEDFKHAFKR